MLAEKFTQIEHSHRRVLLSAIILIAGFGLYRWIYAPFNSQLFAAQLYNSSLNQAIHKAEMISNLQEIKKSKIDELKKESDRLRNQLFTSNEMSQFFASLPSIVFQAGCVTQSISLIPETQKNQADSSSITPKKAMVTFLGAYSNAAAFFGRLQNSDKKIWIESVKMDTAAGGKLKCQALLTIYCIERAENNLYD